MSTSTRYALVLLAALLGCGGSPSTAPSDVIGATQGLTQEELERAVASTCAAHLPIAVVDLLGEGQRFSPSRGADGQRYAQGAFTMRILPGSPEGAYEQGLHLYPPPPKDARRIIVLPYDRGNWFAYDPALERRIALLLTGR